jgi:thioredoxin reductase (NADPH)
MESMLIWIVTAIIFGAIFVPYFIKFRRRQKLDLARKREADDLGVIRPRSQYPLVDNGACIGCGSCVEACPEGDVLGVVFGKAAVINGDRCVGHGYCEQVCPVGALKVGLGDIKTRDDIPLMDEYNQTTVPGIFIAGELGGISLIRNAVVQGKMVVNRVGDLLRDGQKAEYDLAIVGCGPAGLSAALSAEEKRISYVAFDQQDPGGTILQYPRRKLVMTQPVEIPLYGKLTNPEYSKEDLLDIWLNIISRFQLNIQPGAKIENITGEDGAFSIPAGNQTVTARYVVLAMGRRGTPRKLGVPGEQMSKVMYQLIDAQSYNSANLLVVGGGDSAVEAAVGLARQPGNKVFLSYRKPKLFRIKKKNEQNINELIQKKEITPVFSSNVKEIKEKSVVLDVDGEAREIPNDYVFIFAGGIPPFKMLKQMGVAFGGETTELS